MKQRYLLSVSDGKFSLVNPKEREESLTKVDTRAEVVIRFREALHIEAEPIRAAKESLSQNRTSGKENPY